MYSCYKSVKLFILWKKIKCNVCMLLSFIYLHAVHNQLNDGWILFSWFHFRVLVLWMLSLHHNSLVGHLTGGQPSLMLMENIKFPFWKIDFSLDLHLVLQYVHSCAKKKKWFLVKFKRKSLMGEKGNQLHNGSFWECLKNCLMCCFCELLPYRTWCCIWMLLDSVTYTNTLFMMLCK